MKNIWSIFFLFFCCLSCRKTPPTVSINPLSYTKEMAGAHQWTGTYYEFGRSMPMLDDDTTYDLSADGTINVINDSTVIFELPTLPYSSFTLSYSSYNQKNKSITYSYVEYYGYQIQKMLICDSLVYNYEKKSFKYHGYYEYKGYGSTITVNSL